MNFQHKSSIFVSSIKQYLKSFSANCLSLLTRFYPPFSCCLRAQSPAAAAAACSSGGRFPDSLDQVRRLYAARSEAGDGGSSALSTCATASTAAAAAIEGYASDDGNDDDDGDDDEGRDEGEWMSVDLTAMVILAQLERLVRPFGPNASSASASASASLSSPMSSSSPSTPLSSLSSSSSSALAEDAPSALQHPLALDVGTRTVAQLCDIVKLLAASAPLSASALSASSTSSSLSSSSSSVPVSSSSSSSSSSAAALWSPVRTRALLAALRVLTAHIHAAARANLSADELGLGLTGMCGQNARQIAQPPTESREYYYITHFSKHTGIVPRFHHTHARFRVEL
jgi:hypothetical protein